MPIISSSDEFRLLLSKWKNESANIGVIAILHDNPQMDFRATLVMTGKVTNIDDLHGAFSIASDTVDDVIYIAYSDCEFFYGTEAEKELHSLSMQPSGGFDELVSIMVPTRTKFVLYRLKG